MSIASNILHAIGNTSMLRLRKVGPPNGADVFVKLEWENPTGSIKDRMALAVISRAELTLVPSEGGLTTKKLILDNKEQFAWFLPQNLQRVICAEKFPINAAHGRS